MDTPEIEYLNIAIKMMDFKYSLGMIGKLLFYFNHYPPLNELILFFKLFIPGGKPKKALYFVGRIDDSFIILDPHYV